MLNLNLVQETEFFFDDKILTEVLSDTSKTVLKRAGIGTGIASSLLAANYLNRRNINKRGANFQATRQKIQTDVDYADKNGILDIEQYTKEKNIELAKAHKDAIGDETTFKVQSHFAKHSNTYGLGTDLAFVGVVGGYLLYKFFKSLTYANWKIKKLEEKVKLKPELKSKLQLWYAKRDKIKIKLQVENKNFIEKTKLLKAKIAEMERSKSDKEAIAKLKMQLDKRMKFISKIGAKI